MKTKLASVFTILTLLISGGTAAQQAPHVCGAGPGPNEVMAGVQPGGNGVAPTPLCYWKSGAEQEAAARPVQWADRWGALAEDGGGTLGVAVGAVNKGEATKLAIADCRKRGGGRCEISLAFHNQCAVVVAGSTGSNISHAATEEEATALAMKGCEARDGTGACRVYYSGCSLPAQVQ